MKAAATGTIHGDKTTDRKNIGIPADLYERLLEMASELNYSHKGQVNILPMLDALTNLDIAELEQTLRDNGLLQKRGSDRLW